MLLQIRKRKLNLGATRVKSDVQGVSKTEGILKEVKLALTRRCCRSQHTLLVMEGRQVREVAGSAPG